MTAHIHAALMLQYAQDAAETDKPWERWEFKTQDGYWLSNETHPSWSEDNEYRRKPRTIKVNGFDVPEPVKSFDDGTYWLAEPGEDKFTDEYIWIDDSEDHKWLSRGLIHSTKEAAAKHAMAMCGIDPATYKDE